MMTRMISRGNPRGVGRLKSERGDSELVSLLVVIPLVIWIIFTIIDVSMYMQARTKVQSVVRDGARQVAIYGGNNSSLNPYDVTVANQTKTMLYKNGKCIGVRCAEQPTLTCTPAVATQAGQQVSCTSTFTYKSIYGFNPFGFNFLMRPFEITEYAFSETGF